MNECNHEEGKPGYDHWKCTGCTQITTDGGWGIASRMTFKSIQEAKFYQKHGKYPE